MSFVNIIFISFLIFIHTIKITNGQSCEARSRDDLTLEPTFWCNVRVDVTFPPTNECFIVVQEMLEIPWSPGQITRAVLYQRDQELYDISAFLDKDGEEVPLEVSANAMPTKVRTDINVKAPKSSSSVVVLLRYKIAFGLMKFVECPSIGPFGNNPESEEREILFTRWLMGGFTVNSVRMMTVMFTVPRDEQRVFIDSNSNHPDGSKVNQRTITNNVEKTVVQLVVNSEKYHPAKFIFYARISSVRGSTCDIPRSCNVENGFLLEKGVRDQKDKSFALAIALGITGGVCVLIILGWIIWCRRAGRTELDDPPEGSLPPSLAHFAYDTTKDDLPERGKQWKEWTKGGLTPAASGHAVLATELSKGGALTPAASRQHDEQE